MRERPDLAALGRLRKAAWGGQDDGAWWQAVLERSLTWITAFDGTELVGFVNVAWDGGVHAFLLDTTVHPDWGRRGIGVNLVWEATQAARAEGIHWLHVDYEPHLHQFYELCGFRPTSAGLLKLH
ncbi:GNAT family N-acetyltransferase [Deinococcus radiopugnans]|uniref:GNAT superfamily N-acetyltransferase n=1 Tax=Deinococcus radiopugnans ATCC 19172 TaxID=585398 RepID=A0ABR6NQM9_9DEIO|nr:GNAT family N-acetyltransferase [Deinococcus radiopugnans]MBB6016333.1 GNAT superfamily N-acetyltransferase [Deinococcus radiopugnans ATCC 19172]